MGAHGSLAHYWKGRALLGGCVSMPLSLHAAEWACSHPGAMQLKAPVMMAQASCMRCLNRVIFWATRMRLLNIIMGALLVLHHIIRDFPK